MFGIFGFATLTAIGSFIAELQIIYTELDAVLRSAYPELITFLVATAVLFCAGCLVYWNKKTLNKQ